MTPNAQTHPRDRAIYPPVDQLKPVGESIWLVDGPTVPFGLPCAKIDYPTRMTIIRLNDGGLFLHSPIRFTETLAETVSALGPVRHLVSPNRLHHLAIREWSERFPDATTWASPGVRDQSAARFDRDLSDEAPKEWKGQIGQVALMANSFLQEIAFHHYVSRTLILTDYIENFEAEKFSPKWLLPLARLGGVVAPNAGTPRDIQVGSFRQRDAMRADFERLLAFRPERLIVAHGAWWPENGEAALRKGFAWLGAAET